MRSLRARVFATTAIVLAAATIAAGLLSRQATLVEERQILGPRRPPPLDGAAAAVQAAYAAGGWEAARRALTAQAAALGVRLIAVDARGAAVAVSDGDLDDVRVRAAQRDGSLSLETARGGTRATVEIRGGPTFAIVDAAGAEAGRVYLLPADAAAPAAPRPLLAPWMRTTLGTAAAALAIAFVVGGRILRPVSDLTRAARQMREGDLSVRVEARGEDEIARLARAFNEMAERLGQTERLKRQMVSDVAHELRSPVTNLRCGLEAIQDGLAAPDRDRIDMLHGETLLLQRLIADLQDLALADADGLRLERAPVALAGVLRRAAGAPDAIPPVHISIDGDAATVMADEGRLEQILRNLLDNARRHTPAGGRIEVSASRRGDAVEIAVADSGDGIAAVHLPHVFDRFYRADASRDRATGGAGLGLAIVRRLAEAQGGTVTARSAGPGQGATFTIRLSAPEH